eukprot:860638-Rhodomonas_salina.3
MLLSAYALAERRSCMLLAMYGSINIRARYAMPGTDMAYVVRYAVSGTKNMVLSSYVLAMRSPGTAIVYPGIGLCACYAMSGTEFAYGATRHSRMDAVCHAERGASLRACYAMSGTDIAYGVRPGHSGDESAVQLQSS